MTSLGNHTNAGSDSATFDREVDTIDYPNSDGEVAIDYNFKFNGYPKFVAFSSNDLFGEMLLSSTSQH